jgi:predicted N-acyltransferase
MDKLHTVGAASDVAAQTRMVPALTVHWHQDLHEIPAADWDALVRLVPGGSPFLSHAFMCAMVDSGSACANTGWLPLFLTLQDESGRVLAGCPAFVKSHSYGEYVFDWAWADAHDRALAAAGITYFPKLLSAVPFSPIPGARLLTHPDLDGDDTTAAQMQLLQALEARCQAQGWSSAHALFVSKPEADMARAQGWLVRDGVQFHWQNRPGQPYADFGEFLASLQRDKRKKIQQERRKVSDAGVHFEVREGAQIGSADWDFFYRCYSQTYREHGQQPYLSRDFWHRVASSLPRNWVLFTAKQGGESVACALLAVDPVHKVAYGRYWGAVASVSCLHFEACYYQPLNWCIEQGYARFEGGAQGEHKLARGLLASPTQSVHWLRHEGLKSAVADFLAREHQGIGHYIDELDERRPFKPQPSDV